MTPEQREELKQAAQNATRGPWMRLFGERTVYDRMEDGCRGNAIVRADLGYSQQDTMNLDFIALANPAAILSLIAQVEALTVPEKMAPVQGYKAGIPWSLHLEAYDAYSKRYAPQQALIEGGCRGGFGTGELDMFIPDWRERVSEIGRLKARIAELERAAPTIPAIPGTKEGA